MKPSCTSNEMIYFVAHFDVSKLCEIKKKIQWNPYNNVLLLIEH